MSRIPTFLAVLATLSLTLAAPGIAKKAEDLPADHPFLLLLASTDLGRGREHRALLVYPIAAGEKDPEKVERSLTSAEAASQEYLSVAEPEKDAGHGPVELFNWSTRPILLLAGEVLEGGVRDRFLARDVLLGPGHRVVAPAYPADRVRRKSSEAKKQLVPLDLVAPDLLRLVCLSDAPPTAVDAFLTDEYALAGEKHERFTLPHLYESKKLAARLGEYRAIFGGIPDELEKRTIGVAALVGDRLVGVDIFGSNAAFRAHWPKILHNLAFQSALYENSYGLLAMAFPNAGKDPDRHKDEIKDLLKKPFGARATTEKPVDAGTELRLSRDQMLGSVLLEGDRLVHALLHLDYLRMGVTAAPPPGAPPPEVSPGELERRAERGRLTEYEKRLLERMRRRRGGTGPIRRPGRDGDNPGGNR